MRDGFIKLLWIGPLLFLADGAIACQSTWLPGILFSESVDTDYHYEATEEARDRPGGFFPTTNGAACSFALAGDFDNWVGTPVAVLDGGLLVQTVGRLDRCSPSTNLVVVDCQNAETALIIGDGPNIEGNSSDGRFPNLIGHHLAPKGSIDVVEAIEIQPIILATKARGLKVFENSNAMVALAEMLDGEQLNLFCGCKHYFPSSAGANK